MTAPRLSEAIALLHQISAEFNIDVKSLRGPSRRAHFVEARRQFCVRGRQVKIRLETLAEVICRDHTTVLHHSSGYYKARKLLRLHEKRDRMREACSVNQ